MSKNTFEPSFDDDMAVEREVYLATEEAKLGVIVKEVTEGIKTMCAYCGTMPGRDEAACASLPVALECAWWSDADKRRHQERADGHKERLMRAAAPDMLEALKSLVGACERLFAGGVLTPDQLNKARAALAKAEGKS